MNKYTLQIISILQFNGIKRLHYNTNHLCQRFNISNKLQVNIFTEHDTYSVGTAFQNKLAKYRVKRQKITPTTPEYILSIIKDFYP